MWSLFTFGIIRFGMDGPWKVVDWAVWTTMVDVELCLSLNIFGRMRNCLLNWTRYSLLKRYGILIVRKKVRYSSFTEYLLIRQQCIVYYSGDGYITQCRMNEVWYSYAIYRVYLMGYIIRVYLMYCLLQWLLYSQCRMYEGTVFYIYRVFVNWATCIVYYSGDWYCTLCKTVM